MGKKNDRIFFFFFYKFNNIGYTSDLGEPTIRYIRWAVFT